MSVKARERKRIDKLRAHENQARLLGHRMIAGVDEAGRGPLAGPVVAAACIIPQGIYVPGVNDSKSLLPTERFEVFQRLIADERVLYGVGIIDSVMIDQINILQATFLAMTTAIQNLKSRPDFILVDGPYLPPHVDLPGLPVIDGDVYSYSIAAASIIAKETRDQMMRDYHQRWPEYGFDEHKGYYTQAHIQAIGKHGPCPIHRRSFDPLKSMLNPPEFVQPQLL